MKYEDLISFYEENKVYRSRFMYEADFKDS